MLIIGNIGYKQGRTESAAADIRRKLRRFPQIVAPVIL